MNNKILSYDISLKDLVALYVSKIRPENRPAQSDAKIIKFEIFR
jgi:hypothetical protein